MSNRKKSTRERVLRRAAHQLATAPRNPLSGFEPWLWAMQDADEAERRGDAERALAAIRRRMLDPEGRLFWRPSRIERLEQLVRLKPLVPRWAISRWILEQALQHLAECSHGRDSRMSRAVDVAVGLRGGLAAVRGTTTPDKRAQVIDHDWVCRQVHLFELDGLDAFLRDGASPDLAAGADRIEEWGRQPMGGFVFAGPSCDTLLWMDLASDQTVRTPNIGTGTYFAAGDHVIGRLVPVAGGVMFEGPPLAVPRPVAVDVARDPARWLDVLRHCGLVRSGEIRTDVREWTGLLSDVPTELTTTVLSYRPDEQRMVLCLDGRDRARATLLLARTEFAREVRDPEACACHEDEAGTECDDCFDDGWDGWAHVHAALVDSGVAEALPSLVGPGDVELLRQIHGFVAEPARALLASLIEQLADAA